MTASKDVVIQNTLGLHARPAMQFVDLASQYRSAVRVTAFGEGRSQEADGKSVMQMLTLEAFQGTRLRIVAEGDDAEAAVERLVRLVDEKFGEEP